MKKIFLPLLITTLVFSSAFLIAKTSQAREKACYYSCGEPQPCQGTQCGTQCCGSPLRTGEQSVPHEQLLISEISIKDQILSDAKEKQIRLQEFENGNPRFPLRSGAQGPFVNPLLQMFDNFSFYGATLSPSDNIIGRNSVAAFDLFHGVFGVRSSEIAGQFSQADFNKLKGFIGLFSQASAKLPTAGINSLTVVYPGGHTSHFNATEGSFSAPVFLSSAYNGATNPDPNDPAYICLQNNFICHRNATTIDAHMLCEKLYELCMNTALRVMPSASLTTSGQGTLASPTVFNNTESVYLEFAPPAGGVATSLRVRFRQVNPDNGNLIGEYRYVDNVAFSFNLPSSLASFVRPGATYAVDAQACAPSGCSIGYSMPPTYFKVAVKAPTVAPAGSLPIFFATQGDGTTVLKFNGTDWVRISGPAAEPDPIVTPTAPSQPQQNIFQTIGQAISNFVQGIINFFRNIFGFKTTPTIQSNVNLEIVKFGPDANNITATVSQTPNINCGSSCSATYTSNTQLTVTVSGANPIYGNYSYVFYKSDGQNNGTHGVKIADWINTDIPASFSSMINCPPGSPTCTFKMPFVNAELWIGPSTCDDDLAVGVFNAPATTSYIQNSTSAFLSATLGPATPPAIQSTIKYDAKLAWGPNINQFAVNPATGPNSAGTITGSSALALSGTVSSPNFIFPSSNPATGSFYGGIQLIKTLTPIAGFGQPIITPCNLRLRGNNNNPDNPITPAGETTGGRITVVKQTVNANNVPTAYPNDFNFSLTGASSGQATLDTDNSNTISGNLFSDTKIFSPVAQGNFTVSETLPLPVGFQTTAISCTGTLFGTITSNPPYSGPPSISFTKSASGNVTCTFTNKQTVKSATAVIVNPPPPPPPFPGCVATYGSNAYSLNPSTQINSSTGIITFNVNASTVILGPSQRFEIKLKYNGSYLGAPAYMIYPPSPSSVTFTRSAAYNSSVNIYQIELTLQQQNQSTGNWANIGNTCADSFTIPSPPTTGTIIINKVTDPTTTTSFVFSLTGASSSPSITLDTSSSTTSVPSQGTFASLSPGSYTVTELVPSGWIASQISCSSSGPNSTFNDNVPPASTSPQINITNLVAGETVTCTVFNGLQP